MSFQDALAFCEKHVLSKVSHDDHKFSMAALSGLSVWKAGETYFGTLRGFQMRPLGEVDSYRQYVCSSCDTVCSDKRS
jgi:hypothetical protein